MTEKNAVVGIYRHDAEGRGGGGTTLVERVELDAPVKALVRRKGWKDRVSAAATERGFEVLSVNVVHSGGDLDVDIAMTVAKKPARFGERRKAVTVGGRAKEGPIKTGKTMAAKRRAAKAQQ